MESILALKNGDTHAFASIFNAYHERIYFYVLNKTNSTYLAEETTQITFIKLWQYRDKLSEQHELIVQIFRIARTTMIDEVRKTQHREQLNAAQTTHDTEPEGESRMNEKDIQSMLLSIMNTMPPMRRKVFSLSRLNGLTYKQIAAELSISTKTVEGHMGEALKQLKRYMTILLTIYLIYF